MLLWFNHSYLKVPDLRFAKMRVQCGYRTEIHAQQGIESCMVRGIGIGQETSQKRRKGL